MAEMTSELNCTNLHDEPFVDCNSVSAKFSFVKVLYLFNEYNSQ